MAPATWLRENPTTARKLASAVKPTVDWIREHSPGEIRARMPAQRRSPDVDADSRSVAGYHCQANSRWHYFSRRCRDRQKGLPVSVEKVRTDREHNHGLRQGT